MTDESEYQEVVAEREAIEMQLRPLEQEAAKLYAAVDVATRQYKAAAERAEALKVTLGYREVCQRHARLARGRKGNHSLAAEGSGRARMKQVILSYPDDA